MKKLVMVLMVIFSSISFSQNYSLSSSRVEYVNKTTGEKGTQRGIVYFDIFLGPATGYSSMSLSSGAKFVMTPRSTTKGHYIFNGAITTAEAGLALIHFYFNAAGNCYKIIVAWTNLKVVYYMN